jgi:hypothetical protein
LNEAPSVLRTRCDGSSIACVTSLTTLVDPEWPRAFHRGPATEPAEAVPHRDPFIQLLPAGNEMV